MVFLSGLSALTTAFKNNLIMKRRVLLPVILAAAITMTAKCSCRLCVGQHESRLMASMPVGGGDIGMNVWAEDGDVLFYISRSGAYD